MPVLAPDVYGLLPGRGPDGRAGRPMPVESVLLKGLLPGRG
jgi:hypothetical protein